MSQLLHQFTKKYCKASVPDLRAGYLVKVHQKIKEGNKERVQVFEGTVIAVNPGHGVESTFTVRKIAEGVGVEKTYPIHSPNVVKIDVLRAHKVRRAKLGFLRSLSGKALRLKETELKLEHKEFEQEVEEKVEEVKEEAKTEEVVEEKKEETPVEAPKAEEVTEEPKEEVVEEVKEEKKEE
jgi:large subunit ribosomal protein L19